MSFLKGLQNLPHIVVRAVFKSTKPAPGDTTESPSTEFFGYIVPYCFLLQTLMVAVLLMGYAGSAFMDVFLIKESCECDSSDPELPCFFNTNATTLSSKRLNCSVEETFYNGTHQYTCLKFVFAMSEAHLTAGGILSMGAFSFTAVVMLILFISNRKKSDPNRKML